MPQNQTTIRSVDYWVCRGLQLTRNRQGKFVSSMNWSGRVAGRAGHMWLVMSEPCRPFQSIIPATPACELQSHFQGYQGWVIRTQDTQLRIWVIREVKQISIFWFSKTTQITVNKDLQSTVVNYTLHSQFLFYCICMVTCRKWTNLHIQQCIVH